MFRAGLYARVSTNDQQTLAMQNRALREYAARRGWTIALQVREVNSGAARGEAREKLLEAARRREIDLVLVWRLDRWGRSLVEPRPARGVQPDPPRLPGLAAAGSLSHACTARPARRSSRSRNAPSPARTPRGPDVR